MNKKGFTLIELLIVVAIIGILAAVGAAVIPGLLENAKEKATKSILSQTLKYTKTELLRCELGEIKVMENYLTCKNIKSANGAFNTMQALTNIRALRKNNIDYGVLKDSKNPFDTTMPALRSRTNYIPGQISISITGTVISFKACFKKGCAADDRSETFINVLD